MSGNHRVILMPPICKHMVQVAVAYTGIEYLDLYIVISHGMTAELIGLEVAVLFIHSQTFGRYSFCCILSGHSHTYGC